MELPDTCARCHKKSIKDRPLCTICVKFFVTSKQMDTLTSFSGNYCRGCGTWNNRDVKFSAALKI